ncbi:MAG: putative quinol monooxygenase [Actinomycetota bacterium]
MGRLAEALIVVLGDVRVRPDVADDALRISREHVERSRTEPGCISHDVLVDPDEPLRLVFVERWADRTALDVHFAVPESIAFASALAEMASERPHMQILPIEPRD